MTFARALRAILRQDPDVIMVGEIRDLETAQIAVQASLTGHLVLATLHTNDARERGHAPASTWASSRSCSPRACSACSRSAWCASSAPRASSRTSPARPTSPSCGERYAGEKLYAPGGCDACNNTGYVGRTGIYELLVIDEEAKTLIHGAGSEQRLRAHAASEACARCARTACAGC